MKSLRERALLPPERTPEVRRISGDLFGTMTRAPISTYSYNLVTCIPLTAYVSLARPTYHALTSSVQCRCPLLVITNPVLAVTA